MLEIKALTKDYENWGEDADDFYVSFELDVGLHDIPGASDLFTFNVLSPKRLDKILESTEIELGHGYFIMRDFNIKTVNSTVETIMNKCKDDDYDKYVNNLSQYFKLQG
ncbi:Imm8 family immunity protein [Bacillus spizizenii]|jgi:hypothetical protein|uniref:Imm8 family immunity protein n=1 Tax=Bacillus spizizenii TaxID=96241 RepID=UPI0002D2602E|nr:Imm8 family immunity protein [Bacillus spizizenii]OWV35501.1 hypothetical protein CE489_18365 [Bacillus spizizenii]GEK25197.1 hypothetical protein BSU04nite_15860 [Bacillus spizizenii]CUB33658.1 hypothetical protein BN2127_JRS7_00152 [Bacillus subtilis]